MKHLIAFVLVVLFTFPAFAVDVILTSPSKSAFIGDAKLWATDKSPVHEDDDGVDRLGSVLWWFGRADIATTYMVPYRLEDGTYDKDGEVIIAPTFTKNPYIYMRMSQKAWEELIYFTNPVGIMPGGTKIIYAWGLADNTTFRTKPSNGLQHSF